MSNSNLTRGSGLSLLVAGVANALFWLLVIPIGTFVGAAASLNPLWIPAQVFHALAALLALFGLVGLYSRLDHGNRWLGLIGFVLALFGTAFYLADALIALVIFPIAAIGAPSLITSTGALNTSPMYIVFAATFMVGYILFGIVLLGAHSLPRVATLLLIVGAILSNLPPGLLPMYVLIVGGVTWGIGALWLGYALAQGEDDKAT